MGHSDYPLQALLYAAVLHRFLRWRQPGYDPEQPPRRRALPLPARHVRARHPAGRRRRRAASSPGGRRCALVEDALRPARRGGWWRDDRALRADRRARLAAGRAAPPGCWRDFNRGRRARRGRRPRRRRARRLGGEADERVLLAVALAVRAVRRGSVCLDLATGRRRRRPTCPGPTPTAWADAVAASPAGRGRACCGCEHGLLYLDRYHRLETQVCDDLVARAAQPPPDGRRGRAGGRAGAGPRRARQRRAARRRRRAPSGSGRRSSPAAPAPARPPRSRGCWRCSPTRPTPRRAALDRADRARPARPRPGCRRRSTAELAGLAGVPDDRAAARPARRRDPAPAARLAARQQHPVPARPRQPAAVRRGRGRRVLDGRADDDGPAARGGAARQPGWCWSATPTSSPRSGPARCSPTWSPATTGAPTRRSRALTDELPLRADDIKALAEALRAGDADARARACCARASDAGRRSSSDRRRRVGRRCGPTLVAAARASATAAERRATRGGALDGARPAPAAVRAPRGPVRRRHWNRQVERWLGRGDRRRPSTAEWYVGRPLLVTTNDYALDVYNGETGVVVRQGRRPAAGVRSPGSRAARATSRPAGSTPSRRCTR